ncbi:MAG TPA: MFS transporter, partial [Thermoanaerobaculia bacterium]|nr:MFS transporter [Thermoanaerobaculia bacterium]
MDAPLRPAAPEPGPSAAPAGIFEPLQVAVFRSLWIAAIASNVGTWIQSVGEKWLMAELTTSPLLISLIETGTSLPMLLLALPAGALADIFDRRRLLIYAQTYMLLVAAALAALTYAHAVTPLVLLSMSLLIGVGAALTGPAWQARVPELLDRRLIPAGVALNSAGFNVSRAIGPALGGLVVAALGPAFAFLLNAVSFLGTVVALVKWKREVTPSDLPGERFLGAMKVGVRYARHSRELRVILLRAVGFVLFSGIIFSLTPSLAIHRLELSSSAFGLLLGCIGAGALLATAFLPTLRARLAPHTLLTLFTVVFALSLVVLAFVKSAFAVGAALFVCGAGWLSVLSTFNTAVQLSVPSWVRARAFGAYITCW